MDNDEETRKYTLERYYGIKIPFIKDTSPEADLLVQRIARARTILYFDVPFFGYILGQLEIFPVANESLIPKYAADNRRIYVNTQYFESLKIQRIKPILLHLIIHLIMKHGERGLHINSNIWSYSTDVNTLLMVDESVKKLQEYYSEKNRKWELDQVSKIPNLLNNKSSDEIYKILFKYGSELTRKENKRNTIKDQFTDEVIDEIHEYCGIESPCAFVRVYDLIRGLMPENAQALDIDRMQGLIRTAYESQRNQGHLPGQMQELIEDLINPKVPWYVLLSQYLQKTIISDWRWTPPNKRLLHHDIIYPSTVKEYLEVVIALDTSGSITNEELTHFVSESHSIINSVASVKMHLIECDMVIQEVIVIEEGQNINGGDLPWEGKALKGRGGTSFIPVFEYIEEEQISPDLLIYFTDGYGSFPEHEPNYPVIWMITSEVEPPTGIRIQFDSDHL
jgi:predicted metal-dependent peptidase